MELSTTSTRWLRQLGEPYRRPEQRVRLSLFFRPPFLALRNAAFQRTSRSFWRFLKSIASPSETRLKIQESVDALRESWTANARQRARSSYSHSSRWPQKRPA